MVDVFPFPARPVGAQTSYDTALYLQAARRMAIEQDGLLFITDFQACQAFWQVSADLVSALVGAGKMAEGDAWLRKNFLRHSLLGLLAEEGLTLIWEVPGREVTLPYADLKEALADLATIGIGPEQIVVNPTRISPS